MSDQQQICINQCSQARNNTPCDTCLLSTAVQADRAEDTEFEIQMTLNACRKPCKPCKTREMVKRIESSIEQGKQLTDADLDRSANRADMLVFCWFAVGVLIAVMAVMGSGAA